MFSDFPCQGKMGSKKKKNGNVQQLDKDVQIDAIFELWPVENEPYNLEADQVRSIQHVQQKQMQVSTFTTHPHIPYFPLFQ